MFDYRLFLEDSDASEALARLAGACNDFVASCEKTGLSDAPNTKITDAHRKVLNQFLHEAVSFKDALAIILYDLSPTVHRCSDDLLYDFYLNLKRCEYYLNNPVPMFISVKNALLLCGKVERIICKLDSLVPS